MQNYEFFVTLHFVGSSDLRFGSVRNATIILICFLLLPLLWVGCSTSRHVPEGAYLLDHVNIRINDSTGTLSEKEMINYVRQQPNHKVLWGVKLQLGIYNMSGKDTTKWWNRWARRMGQPPVILDSTLTAQGAHQLQMAMLNRGFLHADVDVKVSQNPEKKKADVTYTLSPGKPYIVKSIRYVFPDDTIRGILMADSNHFAVREGDNLDRTLLENEREIFTSRLRDKGYYGFAKEFISFIADTTAGSRDVDLTVVVNPARGGAATVPLQLNSHEPYMVRRVVVVTDYDPAVMIRLDSISAQDTVRYRDMEILYGQNRYLRPSVIYENCFIQAGQLFDARKVDRTYEAFGRLSILKFINVRFRPVANVEGRDWLDAYILLTPGKSQTVSFELEGTNSEGDLGAAASVAYTHRNLGKGSETFSAKFRGAYESLSGNLDGFIHNRYMEYSLETSISFPKFKFPFINENFKRRVRASTEFNLSLNYQERPEYTRVVAAAGWAYRWTERSNRNRHIFTPLDINYVYLPESTNDFIDQIAPDNPLLRYSYEDHFIMRLGYTFYRTNKRRETLWNRTPQSNIFTLRVAGETAGNVLFAINSLFTRRADFRQDPYRVFGIRYSQYVKAEADFALLHTFDHRNSVAFHSGFGIAYPYGNSTILPFEKRFYGGGANGVRGWDVRTLGPGSYAGHNSVTDFINQCGDIRLEFNAEYRAKLFWLLELGAFVDVGNIWTIHNYATQPGGMFHFNRFYKQLAAAYGLGLRLDFTYFLLRLDIGMKAHNPAQGAEPWPLLHPKWGRDSSIHFSIGYPF